MFIANGLLVVNPAFGLGGALHQKPESEAGEEGDKAVDGFGLEEGAAAFGEEGEGGVTVLGDRAGDEDREGYDSCRIEGHEDEVRTGFGDNAYGCGEDNHQSGITAYPMLYVNVLQSDAEDKEHTESPCENRQEVLFDDVVPEVLFYEMIGSEEQNEQHNDAQSGEKYIHPVFAQKIDSEFIVNGFSCSITGINTSVVMSTCGIDFMYIGLVVGAVLTGFRMNVTGMVVSIFMTVVCFNVQSGMRLMSVPGMSAVVVPEVAGGEGGDEGGEADEHGDSFPSVGSVPTHRAPTGRATMRWIGGSGFGLG